MDSALSVSYDITFATSSERSLQIEIKLYFGENVSNNCLSLYLLSYP